MSTVTIAGSMTDRTGRRVDVHARGRVVEPDIVVADDHDARQLAGGTAHDLHLQPAPGDQGHPGSLIRAVRVATGVVEEAGPREGTPFCALLLEREVPGAARVDPTMTLSLYRQCSFWDRLFGRCA